MAHNWRILSKELDFARVPNVWDRYLGSMFGTNFAPIFGINFWNWRGLAFEKCAV